MLPHIYSYAVSDPTYLQDPEFWSLEGFTLGDGDKVGWEMDLRPTAKQGTAALLALLKANENKLSIGNMITIAKTAEPTWDKHTFYDQLHIGITDNDGFMLYKLVFFHIQVEKITIHSPDKTFQYKTKKILCQVKKGAYVSELSKRRS